MMQSSLPNVELVPELSQYFTEEYLANLIGLKVKEHFLGEQCKILEPHAGDGALVKGLLRAGFKANHIVANELDPRLVRKMREDPELAGVTITCADARNLAFPRDHFDVVVDNPPYENGADVEWMRDMLYFAPVSYNLIRAEVEHLVSADKEVFSSASVTWRARCIGRPRFRCAKSPDGKLGGEFEVSVIRLDRGITQYGTVRIQEDRWRRP